MLFYVKDGRYICENRRERTTDVNVVPGEDDAVSQFIKYCKFAMSGF